MHNRLDRLTKWGADQNLDFVFLSDPTNVFYYTGFKCDPHERLLGLFVIPGKEPFLVCPEMEMSQAKEVGWEHQVIGYNDDQNPWTYIKKALQERHVVHNATAAIEIETLPYARTEQLRELFDSLKFTSVEEAINDQRLIKDLTELEHLKKAAELADFAINVGKNAIKKGKTEQALVAEIEYEVKKRGAEGMSFATTVLSGLKSALPHGTPNDRQIREGDFVLFDLGVIVNGYCSDITRTFVYKHASDEQEKIYNAVLEANMAAIQKAQTGVKIGDVDLAARSVIESAGYGKYFTHRVGHGLGLGIHEAPSMNSSNTSILKTGMVFTIEPGIYIPDKGGVRIEDDIYLSEDGPIVLTQFPKELQIIE
ncbi:MAG: M24 family metallopeptidase [Tuberibacillus sp.]